MDLAARADALTAREKVRSGAWAFLGVSLVASALNVVLGQGLRVATGNALFSDFLAHWTAGRLLLDGRLDDLYDPDAQALLQHAIVGPGGDVSWFVGPPFLVLLYAPLAALPYLASSLVWLALSFAALLGALALVRPLVPRLDRDWGTVVLVVLASQPVLETLGSGQDSAVSMLVWAAALRLLAAGRDAWAGAALGAGLIKPQLVILAPPTFLVRRAWAALAAWCGVALVLLGVSLALVGVDGLRGWGEALLSDRYDEQVTRGQAWKQQTVPALLVSLAPAGLARPALVLGLLASAVLVAAMLVVAARAPRGQLLEVWALVALTTVVASPHLLGYDLLVALPALLVLLDRHGSRRVRLALLALFLLTYLGPALHSLALRVDQPLTAVGAPWAVLPLLVLWWDALRACLPAQREAAAHSHGATHL